MQKLFIFGALLLSATTGLPAQAETPETAVARFVENELAGAGRVKVSVGAADPRLPLAACRRLEPFVPYGARLWGRARVGLRCAEGASFTAFLPVEIQVFGPALVAARALSAGSALEPADLKLQELELTRQPAGTLQTTDAAEGKVLARPVAAGQMLRAEYLRTRPAVAAGDPVKIVLEGRGFSVSTEGRALGAAAESQAVRVQTAAGRVLSGTARAGRIVEVAF